VCCIHTKTTFFTSENAFFPTKKPQSFKTICLIFCFRHCLVKSIVCTALIKPEWQIAKASLVFITLLAKLLPLIIILMFIMVVLKNYLRIGPSVLGAVLV